DVRARRMDVRRGRLQAQGNQVALPYRGVPASVNVGQGRSAAPADPARVRALAQALPFPWGGGAGVRPPQARMGAAAIADPWTGSRSAARRPDDPREAFLRARPS